MRIATHVRVRARKTAPRHVRHPTAATLAISGPPVTQSAHTKTARALVRATLTRATVPSLIRAIPRIGV